MSGGRAVREISEQWLSRGEPTAVRDDAGAVLRAWRATNRQSQAAVAELLNTTQQHLSQIEKGTRPLSLEQRRTIVAELGIPAEELGLSSGQARHVASSDDASPEVAASWMEWRTQRRWLNRHRSELARLAVELYPAEQRVPRTPLIAPGEWLPAAPIELTTVGLDLDERPQQTAVDGSEPESAPTRPLRTAAARFEHYTSAVKYLDPPQLFESRPSYRLLGGSLTDRRLDFGLAAYFDKLDVSEALGHELAAACMADPALGSSSRRLRGRLPFRDRIGRSVRPAAPGDHPGNHHVDHQAAPVPGQAVVSAALARSSEGGDRWRDLRRGSRRGVSAVERGAVGPAQRLLDLAQHRPRVLRGAARQAGARWHSQSADRLPELAAVSAARAGA
ncbi:MAG: helix-turn-helix domain-containing protein [Pseudonocardiaceae bacterium]|nr:helix-turn-helix domain-containing protein [Pseudonocardiaceae bacterium]